MSPRVVRTSRSGRRSLTAASKLVEDPAKSFRGSIGSSRDSWQDKAWEMLRVGELRYYVSWRSSSCSRCRLVASDIDPDTGKPTGTTENTAVRDIVRDIAGGYLGQSQLIKRAVTSLTVPGEVWIAMLVVNGKERWAAVNRAEIKSTGRTVTITLDDDTKHDFVQGRDVMFRVWNPDPMIASKPDSPVKATLDPLNEIVRTTATIANASKSRLIGNGVVFVPQEMSLPTANGGPTPLPDGTPGDPASTLPALSTLMGSSKVQALQDLLYEVAVTAYDDPDSMAAMVPIFAGVPGELAKSVSHLKFDNSVSEIAIRTRNDAIARLAMGLDVTPERLLGLGQNSNHWSAWQIGDDDVRLHIAPAMETLSTALTTEVLAPMLELAGIDPTKYCVWFDSSELTADPDKTDEATDAFDRGVITAEAYREFLGLGDSGYDLSSIKGWQELARDQAAKDISKLPMLAPLIGVEIEVNTPAPAIPPPAEEPTDDPVDAETTDIPDTEDDAQDAASSAIIEVMTVRALELAGNRRRTRSDHARLRNVPVRDTHLYMEPVSPEEADRLVSGWDSPIDDQALARLGIDPDQVRRKVSKVARAALVAKVVRV